MSKTAAETHVMDPDLVEVDRPDDLVDSGDPDGTRPGDADGRGPAGILDALASRAADAVDGAAQLARTLPAGIDRAASTTGRTLDEAQRAVSTGSDTALFGGASLAAGLALGLLVGGAPRLVVGVALLPAAALAMALADRRAGRQDLATGPLVN